MHAVRTPRHHHLFPQLRYIKKSRLFRVGIFLSFRYFFDPNITGDRIDFQLCQLTTVGPLKVHCTIALTIGTKVIVEITGDRLKIHLKVSSLRQKQDQITGSAVKGKLIGRIRKL